MLALKRNKTRKNDRAATPGSGSVTAQPSPEPAPVSSGKRWAFRLTALTLLPVGLLVGLELVLRLLGYGYPTAFFLSGKAGGQSILVENKKFGWRFFPREMARTPGAISMPARKPGGVCRIFILGESAAFGDPEPAYGFGRILEVLLQERYPGVRFEVVNAAMTAINSHVILPIARDCAAQDGDVWLVYMGNNEVIGPYGAGTVFGSSGASLLYHSPGRGPEDLEDRAMRRTDWRGLPACPQRTGQLGWHGNVPRQQSGPG